MSRWSVSYINKRQIYVSMSTGGLLECDNVNDDIVGVGGATNMLRRHAGKVDKKDRSKRSCYIMTKRSVTKLRR